MRLRTVLLAAVSLVCAAAPVVAATGKTVALADDATPPARAAAVRELRNLLTPAAKEVGD